MTQAQRDKLKLLRILAKRADLKERLIALVRSEYESGKTVSFTETLPKHAFDLPQGFDTSKMRQYHVHFMTNTRAKATRSIELTKAAYDELLKYAEGLCISMCPK